MLTETDNSAMWRRSGSCTGSCNQGRSCDCVPDVADEPPPLKSDLQAAVWSLIASVVCVIGGALVWHLLARSVS